MEYHPEIYRYIPLFNSVYEKLKANSNNLATFLYAQIEEHDKTIDYDSHSEATDYVEAYLRKQKEIEREGEKDHYYSWVFKDSDGGETDVGEF